MMSNIRYPILIFALLMTGLLGTATPSVQGAVPVNVVSKSQQGCPTGTTVSTLNKVVNGDFSVSAGPGPAIAPAAGFSSELKNVGPNKYPYDEFGGGFSIISTEVFTVADRALVYGYRFSGDSRRNVPALTHYFYAKPSTASYTTTNTTTPGYALLWAQDVTLTVGTTYNFYAYFNNMRLPSVGDNNFINPQIKLMVNGVLAGNAIEILASPDLWLPVQYSFILSGPPVGTQTAVKLEIRDYAGPHKTYPEDDFVMTGVNLRQCVSALGIALANLLPIDNRNGTFDIPFIVNLKNYGVDPLPLTNLKLTSDLARAFQGVKSYQVVSISNTTTSPYTPLTINPNFNGNTDKNLLSGNNSLRSGQSAQIRFTLRITPGTGSNAYGPFNPQIQGSADAGFDGSTPIQVVGSSGSGVDPDPNNGPGSAPTPVYLKPFMVYLPLNFR